MMKILMLCIVSLLMTAAVAQEKIQEKQIKSVAEVKVSVRKNGYTLGDMIKMHVEFTLDKSYSFDPKSVPLVGPIARWIDLRDVRLQREERDNGSEFIQIDFLWQIFGTVKEAQRIKLPEILLRTLPVEVVGEEDKQTKIIKIPEEGVYLSPVLPEQLNDTEAQRPIMPPPRFNTAMPLRWSLLYLTLGILLLTYWLYIKDKIIWLPRHPGAMTLLARQLRQQGVVKQRELTLQDIRTIHAGLAKCAGQSLYPNTLKTLFEQAPYLEADKDNISQFFHDTWQLFHQENTAVKSISKTDTLAWIRRGALAERVFSKK